MGCVAVVFALLVTSCASAENVAGADTGDTGATESTEPTDTTETTPTDTTETTATTPTTSPPPTQPTPPIPDVAPRPVVGNCYQATKRAFRQQRDGTDPVSCSRRHTGETFQVFYVGRYPTGTEIDNAWRKCHGRFPAYVGAAATLSRLDLALILPSTQQVDAGQGWIRCDVIKKNYYNSRVGFPVTGSVRNVLAGGVPREYRGCVIRWPKVDQAVTFASCNGSHQAELIPEALFLGPPQADYPGMATAKLRSEQFCESVFQDYVPETLNYYYYYPTAASWRSGSHYTTCWALDTEGDGLPPL